MTQNQNLNHYTLIQQQRAVNKIISLLSEPFTDKCRYIRINFEYNSGNSPCVEIKIGRRDIEVDIYFYDSETIQVSLSKGNTHIWSKAFDIDCLDDDFTKYLDNSVEVKYDN